MFKPRKKCQSDPGSRTYTYTPAGKVDTINKKFNFVPNRTGVAVDIENDSDRIKKLAIGQGSFTPVNYYPNGNTKEEAGLFYQYNSGGNLNVVWSMNSSGEKQQVLASYGYDWKGRRVSKTRLDGDNNQDRHFIYSKSGKLLGIYNHQPNTDSPALVHEIIYLEGRPFALYYGNDKFYYIHSDRLGIPRAITNQQGQTIWRLNGSGYGGNFSVVYPKAGSVKLHFHQRLPGQYLDPKTGNFYNLHRYYNPITGRYLTPDPLGAGGSDDTNLYRYATNNPAFFTDPKGLAPYIGGGAFGGIPCMGTCMPSHGISFSVTNLASTAFSRTNWMQADLGVMTMLNGAADVLLGSTIKRLSGGFPPVAALGTGLAGLGTLNAYNGFGVTMNAIPGVRHIPSVGQVLCGGRCGQRVDFGISLVNWTRTMTGGKFGGYEQFQTKQLLHRTSAITPLPPEPRDK